VSGVLQFPARNGYIASNSQFGRIASYLRFNSIEFDLSEKRGTPMDQVAEQAIEIKEEIVELTLAELGQVGGGAVPVFA